MDLALLGYRICRWNTTNQRRLVILFTPGYVYLVGICVGRILVPASASGFHCYCCCKLARITYIVWEKSQDGMPQGRGASSCFLGRLLFFCVLSSVVEGYEG